MPEGTNTAAGGNPAIPIEQIDRDRAKALWDFMQAQGPVVEAAGGAAIGREMLRLFSIHRADAFAAAGKPIDATQTREAEALEWAAQEAYRICAETRHVALGDQVASAIRARAALKGGPA